MDGFADGHAARTEAERQANADATRRGEPLPYPNVWDALDPTKAPADATPEEVAASHREFERICRRRPKKTLSL